MPRLLRPALLASVTLALAGALTLVAAVLLGGSSSSDGPTSGASTAVRSGTVSDALAPSAARGTSTLVTSLQERLRRTPGDQRAWSTLALAYVESARISADPTYYPKADRALARAAKLAPGDSVMLTARAALAAARHDFAGALRAADAANDVNPYSAGAFALRADALTELGRYPAARVAATKADDLEPGPITFTRLSYQAELRGQLREASRLMRLARRASTRSAPGYAFASFHLGELARAAGDPKAAERHYRAALEADPTYMPAVAGVARLQVARGHLAAAERAYRRVVRRLPLTEYVVELGELYQSTGRARQAEEQYAIAAATARLFAANGVSTDLETAQFEADHGSPADALTAARAEWSRRHSIHAADALGWSLHRSGHDGEALHYARLANRLGTHDARLIYHLGAIEAALGRPGGQGHLRAARTLDAGVSPWRERAIDRLLRSRA